MATDWVKIVTPVEIETRTGDAIWREEGIFRGGCLGLVAAILYLPGIYSVLALLRLPEFLSRTDSPSNFSVAGENSESLLFGFVLIFISVFIVGGLPSAVIGCVTGSLLASRMEKMPSPTGRQATFVGLQTGFVVLLAVHLLYFLLWHDFGQAYWPSYFFFLGMPSLIFLCLAVFVAHRMRPRGHLPASGDMLSTEKEAV